ncbi:MAG: hypothetical protein SGI87_10290 [Flavobacteriales bacterium]|nr:hypothetical protein [Flavobacteriales bacterium]
MLAGLSQTQAQLVDVIVEECGTNFGTGYPSGHTTYRVFARLQDPGDFLSAVYGIGASNFDTDHTLTIAQSPNEQYATTLWNSPFGGLTGADINTAFCGIFPEVCFDSFLTIGRGNSASPGGSINILTTPTGLFNQTFGNAFPVGSPTAVNDGAWFALSGDINGYPTLPDNRVLILQMTVPTGTLSYALNIQVINGGNGSDPLCYAHTMEGPLGEIDGELAEDFTCFGLVLPPPPTCSPCDDPLACNYNPLSVGSSGCVYDAECNYSALSTIDDGSCLYGGACFGCIDEEAGN